MIRKTVVIRRQYCRFKRQYLSLPAARRFLDEIISSQKRQVRAMTPNLAANKFFVDDSGIKRRVKQSRHKTA
jgi:hypothetical protein